MAGRLQPDDFPNLNSENHFVSSPRTRVYNCIAWAAGLNDRWLWPTTFFWPIKTHTKESIDSFVDYFESLDFRECDDSDLEKNYEKIALFAQENKKGRLVPTHAARQLDNGHWTSKMGEDVDIIHQAVDNVSGPADGNPIKFMKRHRR